MTDSDRLLQTANDAFVSGRFADAVAAFRALLADYPDVVELHINLGAALRGMGDLAGAEASYRRVLEAQPKNALTWYNLGNLLREMDRGEEALHAFQQADAAQPGSPEILNNLGVQSYDLGRIEEAIRHYDAALLQQPDFADALTNRGNALQHLCRMDEAAHDLDLAIELAPENSVFLLNKCAYLAATGQYDQAMEWVERSIAADPTYVQAILKRASLRIQQGDLARGWEDYEARWRIANWHALADQLPMPVWSGENLAGKHLLVWNEQGYGDALMYARFLPRLAEMAGKVTFACEPPLHRLLNLSLGDAVEIAPLDPPPTTADYHLSLMSVPHRLALEMSDLSPSAPYLQANPTDVATWQERLDSASDDDYRIGLIWAGNPNQAHDYSRSAPIKMMRCLSEIKDVQAFNLLVGPRGDVWRDELLCDLRNEISDFADSAAAMCAMDRIVSVDSAPAHLAGGLGRPLSVLLSFDPDSRYFVGSPISPWYPTATLFRQQAPGDWAPPIAAAAEAISEKASSRPKS